MERHWLNGKRLVVYSTALLVVYLFLGIYVVFKMPHGIDPRGFPFGCDFMQYWGASHLALSGHAVDAYDPLLNFQAEKAALPDSGFSAPSPWVYPPTFFLLILPLALLPYFLSLAVFLIATFGLYLGFVGQILHRREALLPLLAFPGVFVNVGGGQNGFLTAALATGALLQLRRRPALAGVLIGLLTIKPHLGLLMPVILLCGRHWRALFFAVLTAVLFLGLSLAVLGFDTLPAFLARLPVVAAGLGNGSLPLHKMPTFYAFFFTLGVPQSLAYVAHGAVAVAVAAAVAWMWWRRANPALCAAAALVGTLLMSPYLFDYDLMWLVPALAWFVDYTLQRGWRRGERELAVAVWLLPGAMIPLHYLSHQQFAPLLLLAFFLLLLRRGREDLRYDHWRGEGGPAEFEWRFPAQSVRFQARRYADAVSCFRGCRRAVLHPVAWARRD